MSYGQCRCGFYHYTVKHYQQVHGNSTIPTDPYVQAPFVKGELLDENNYDSTEPYPVITYKWICQFCGQETDHESNCYFNLNNYN